MRFDRMMRRIIAISAIAALSACNGPEMRYNGHQGVPLSELDTSGAAPTGVSLMGPDRVLISEGADFAITVEGDKAVTDKLRFTLDDGELGIGRTGESLLGSSGIATVRLIMPAPRQLTLAGSGEMVSERLAGDAEVVIAGSGSLETPQVEAEMLDITIAGSGRYRAAGTARTLDLSVAGSGDADHASLRTEQADVTIAGSGNTIFTSDREVSASIMGSGDVTVRGTARCTLSSLGSGTLTCDRTEETAA